jgi:hypothetical protein
MTLSQFILEARTYGVDLPWLGAFILATGLTYFPVHPLVYKMHDKQLGEIVKKSPNKTLESVEKEKQAVRDRYDMEFAPIIGSLERVLYVYCVMQGAYALLSGWLVMKAFTAWLEQKGVNPAERMRYYHLYLYGNILSLFGGLAAGAIGLAVYKTFNHFIQTS